jgi:hypothetical protein
MAGGLACALAALSLAALPQRTVSASPQNSASTAQAEKTIVLRGCVVPGANKEGYVLTHLSEVTSPGQSAMPAEAHGRRVVFWLDKRDEMLEHANKAVSVTGKIEGVENSEIELKNGPAKDGGLLAEFEGPGKDVKVPNSVVGNAVGTAGRATPEKNDIKTMLVKVKVGAIQETSNDFCQ